MFFLCCWLVLLGCAPTSRKDQLAAFPTPTVALPATATVTPAPPPTARPSATAAIPTLAPSSTPQPSATPVEIKPLRFAVIGDYGEDSQGEKDVAAMVKSWGPDLIITTGDNNYPQGSAATIDRRVGAYFHDFIYPYSGTFGSGADRNRFFPSLGNHDWLAENAQPYLDYFTLPGNERYYDFVWEPVHFFALDSDSHEPDGVASSSPQAAWLAARLAASTSPWQVVYMHHPPYSSGLHGPVDWMRWPFAEWGADAVLAGHDHTYERIQRDGIVYFVNGVGGGPIYYFNDPTQGSAARYNSNFGAMLVTADQLKMMFQFFNRKGELVDEYIMQK